MPLELQEININFLTHDSIWEIWRKINTNFQTIKTEVESITVPEITIIDGGNVE